MADRHDLPPDRAIGVRLPWARDLVAIAGRHPQALTPYQREFAADTAERLARHGRGTWLTARQRRMLEQIEADLLAAGVDLDPPVPAAQGELL
jgi:hypothetical protein